MNVNIAIVLYKFDNLPSIPQIDPVLIIRNDQPNELLAYRDASIQIDRNKFINRAPIDWVLFAINPAVRYENFLNHWPYMEKDTIYSTEPDSFSRFAQSRSTLLGNFYCRPHVFAFLGNAYKVSVDYEHFIPSDNVPIEISRLIFAISRSGYNLTELV